MVNQPLNEEAADLNADQSPEESESGLIAPDIRSVKRNLGEVFNTRERRFRRRMDGNGGTILERRDNIDYR